MFAVVHYCVSTSVVICYEFCRSTCNIQRTHCATIVLCIFCAHILTVEVLYTETCVTTFMIFQILVQILWKNSIDFLVFILFIIPVLGIISNLFLADRSWRGRLFYSSFPSVPVFLPDHGQCVGLKHAV